MPGTIQTFEIQQIIGRFVISRAFFLSQRQRSQCVFRTLTKCFNGGFIQTVDFQQFFHRHIGQLFQRGEAFFNQHCREIFINIKIFGEGIDSGMRFRLGA